MTPAARPVSERAIHELTWCIPDTLTAPGEARAVVRDSLREWDLLPLVDAAELAASELVTNAVQHGLPPRVLELRHSAECLRLEVRDARPSSAHAELPVVSQHDDESGRGQ